MNSTIISIGAAIFLFAAAVHSYADIIAGPITNPANGHDYYLLTPNTWTASEAEAEGLGGTLAIINDAGEQEWVSATFISNGGTNRNLWIGLHRQWQGGPFTWVTGERPDYVHWGRGQPDNGGGTENCAHIWGRNAEQPDAWNDLQENYSSGDETPCGIVEVPGKSNEKTLGKKETSLIGTWYEGGNAGRPCWIAGAGSALFAIDSNLNTSRVIFTTEGHLFSAHWKQHAEIVNDKILWSKGNWWSRKPSDYSGDEKASSKKPSQVH